MKILTTNIWRYYEWEKRKKKVINFFKEQDADIIFLQEAAYDERKKEMWANQVEEINKKLNYRDSAYGNLIRMKKWHGKEIDWIMFYGFGILSKYPIKNSEVVILPHIEKKKDFGFMHTTIKTPHGEIDLINVHLENTDKGSKEQLKQALQWCKDKGIKPIIAGDFNMKIIENLRELAAEDYNISYLIKKYISFMPTNFSHNDAPITLDYILSHKKKFEMKNIECINNDISDHNPVLAEIKII
jgi:endonuclease/exonuclease/phosphatase family metal-dependent hydrolase